MTLNVIGSRAFVASLILLPLIFNPFSGLTEGVKFVILMILAFLCYLSANRKIKLNNVFKYSIAGLIITGAIATTLANNVYLSFWGSDYRHFGFLALLAGIFLALGLPKIKSKTLIRTLILSGTITSIVAILLGIFSQSTLFEGRISGTMGNPNLLGQFLIIPLFFSIYRYMEKKQKIDILNILIQGTSLILTGNRASILALILVSIFYVLTSKKSWKSLLIIFGFSAIACVLSVTRILSLQSIQTRLEIYASAVKTISKNSLFGVGFEHLPYYLKLPASYTLMADRAHQFFLDLAISGGIPFMIAFSMITISTLAILLKKQKILGLGFLGLLISLQFNFMGIMDIFLFSIFIGLAFQQSKAKTNI